MPTLVIHPESDRLVNPENSRDIAARIPGARLVLLPAASHSVPDRIARPSRTDAVLEFLREVARGGGGGA